MFFIGSKQASHIKFDDDDCYESDKTNDETHSSGSVDVVGGDGDGDGDDNDENLAALMSALSKEKYTSLKSIVLSLPLNVMKYISRFNHSQLDALHSCLASIFGDDINTCQRGGLSIVQVSCVLLLSVL